MCLIGEILLPVRLIIFGEKDYSIQYLICMAHNDTEIEIKIPLEEGQFTTIKEALQKSAQFVKETRQEDTYFTPAHRKFLEPKSPIEWLSVRARGGKNILNYKHWYLDKNQTFTHCDEFETEVQDTVKLMKIFSALNFKELVTIKKLRTVYHVNQELEVSMDRVEDLG